MKVLISIMLAMLPVVHLLAGQGQISFKPGKIAYAPKEFYISEVDDDRTDKANDVSIADAGKKESWIFTGGLSGSLKEYIGSNLSQNNSAPAVILHVSELNVTARRVGAMWQINGTVTFGFTTQDKGTLSYTSTRKGTTKTDPGSFTEQFLRETLAKNVEQFDTWYSTHKGKESSGAATKINVVIGKKADVPNSFVYSLQRPLHIPDFQGRPYGREDELAVTVSGIELYYTSETDDDELTLNITVTPYFDKSRSFFKEEGKNARVLAHEQAHFDIAAIRACKMAEEIRHANITKDNYEQVLEQMRQQNMKQLGEDQAAYDGATNHGIITDKQVEWQNKIAAEVRAIGCY